MNEEVLKGIIDNMYASHTPKRLKRKIHNINHSSLTLESKLNIILRSLNDLSTILASFYKLWCIDQSAEPKDRIYSDLLLEFIGAHLIKEWPNKELVFQSKGYSKDPKNGTIKEHNAPITFFRDIFEIFYKKEVDAENPALPNAFFYCLVKYYRVTNISKSEDDEITQRGLKSKASSDRYKDIEILGDDYKYYKNTLENRISK